MHLRYAVHLDFKTVMGVRVIVVPGVSQKKTKDGQHRVLWLGWDGMQLLETSSGQGRSATLVLFHIFCSCTCTLMHVGTNERPERLHGL